jgi:hypothetical protein
MQTFHPTFSCHLKNGGLTCCGSVRPTPVSREYDITVVCQFGKRPRVFVIGQLRRRTPGEPIPHSYSINEPCVYFPSTEEWRPDMKIATTIIGWASLWLAFYEGWLATGEWQGGGIAHSEVA